VKVGGAGGASARWNNLLRQAELEAGRTATSSELASKDAVKSGGDVYFVDKAKQGEPTDSDLANKTAVIDDDSGKAFWVDQKRTDAAETSRQSELQSLQAELPSEVGARQQLQTELEQFKDGVDARFQTAYQQGMNTGLDKTSGGKLPGQFDNLDIDDRMTPRDVQHLGLDPSEVVGELDQVVMGLRKADYKQAGISGEQHPSKLEGGDLARWQRVQLSKADSEGNAAFLMNPTNHPTTSSESKSKLQALQEANQMLEKGNELRAFLKGLKGNWKDELKSQMTSSLMNSGKLGLSQIQGLMAAVGVK
jgi:hypothetical protein